MRALSLVALAGSMKFSAAATPGVASPSSGWVALM
jgi:hypothetical protein